MDNLTALIKRAAMEAVEAGKPTKVVYGQVYSKSPLKVKVSEKLILTSDVLIVPEYLTDHEITLKDSTNAETKHTIKNALNTGDRVIMIRNNGGQQYFIIDRTVNAS